MVEVWSRHFSFFKRLPKGFSYSTTCSYPWGKEKHWATIARFIPSMVAAKDLSIEKLLKVGWKGQTFLLNTGRRHLGFHWALHAIAQSFHLPSQKGYPFQKLKRLMPENVENVKELQTSSDFSALSPSLFVLNSSSIVSKRKVLGHLEKQDAVYSPQCQGLTNGREKMCSNCRKLYQTLSSSVSKKRRSLSKSTSKYKNMSLLSFLLRQKEKKDRERTRKRNNNNNRIVSPSSFDWFSFSDDATISVVFQLALLYHPQVFGKKSFCSLFRARPAWAFRGSKRSFKSRKETKKKKSINLFLDSQVLQREENDPSARHEEGTWGLGKAHRSRVSFPKLNTGCRTLI